MGFPPALTRQGYRLLEYGFTWSKDWYFSEGGHEGGQKIQGEKPLHERARRSTCWGYKPRLRLSWSGGSLLKERSGISWMEPGMEFSKKSPGESGGSPPKSGAFPSRAVSEVAITSRAFIP